MIIDEGPEDAFAITEAAWEDLRLTGKAIGLADMTVESLTQFSRLMNRIELEKEDRLLIIDQAEALFKNFYAHAPFKSKNPMDRIPSLRALAEGASDLAFHRAMAEMFLDVEDAHTLYGLPAPYKDSLAFLPFQIKSYVDNSALDQESSDARYVVSKLMPGFRHEHFKVGVEIVGWSSYGEELSKLETTEPMKIAVQRSAGEEVGGNPATAHAHGLRRMFLRSLTFRPAPGVRGSIKPDVLVDYIDGERENQRRIRVPWGVARGLSSVKIFGQVLGSGAANIAHDGKGSMLIYSPHVCAYEYSGEAGEMHSKMKEIFEFQYAGAPDRKGSLNPAYLRDPLDLTKKFGYIRIKNFDLHWDGTLTREAQIAEEFKRLLEIQLEHAPDGLILDLRGNPGGNVKAAEALLQMLTPKTIEPAKFHWIRSDATKLALEKLSTTRNSRKVTGSLPEEEQAIFDGLNPQFKAWLEDLQSWDEDQVSDLKKFLTSGQNVTQKENINDIGQIYQGPVLLLVDAFTYSAADIFAGGFQDHEIGPILGLDKTTGGGGAVVQEFNEIRSLARFVDVELKELPKGVSMRMAVLRSTRVLQFENQPIENVGVLSDEAHHRCLNDVLQGNPLMILRACEMLSQRKAYRLAVDGIQFIPGGLEFTVKGSGYSTLQAELDKSILKMESNGNDLFQVFSSVDPSVPHTLVLRGIDENGKVVVSTRKSVPAQ